jgi:hypothetical protein
MPESAIRRSVIQSMQQYLTVVVQDVQQYKPNVLR